MALRAHGQRRDTVLPLCVIDRLITVDDRLTMTKALVGYVDDTRDAF